MNHGDASSSMVNGNSSKLTMMSYFARFNYTFADKYLIELTGRYDGSSRFTAKNRWGFFLQCLLDGEYQRNISSIH